MYASSGESSVFYGRNYNWSENSRCMWSLVFDKKSVYICRQLTGPHLKKLSLELGGKNATIVWRDAPIESERMMTSVVRSAFANSGQVGLGLLGSYFC